MGLTAQTRNFAIPRTLLLNALYDVIDRIGAKLVSGDSDAGSLQVKMPDGYGEVTVQLCGIAPCEVTVTAGTKADPQYGYEREIGAIQYLFSQLELFLAGLT